MICWSAACVTPTLLKSTHPLTLGAAVLAMHSLILLSIYPMLPESCTSLSPPPTEVGDHRVIISGKGTIRGKKHGVRKKLEVIRAVDKYANLEDDLLLRLYEGTSVASRGANEMAS